MSGKARWPDSCAKDTNRRDGEPAVAPRLVPGAKLSSSRDGNSRPRGPTSGRRRQAQPEKGAPRSTTREDTTRSIVASPPHFDASSLSVQTVCRPARQQRQGRCPASHRVAHRRPAAAWPSGRADADRGGSRSRCGSSRYATDGLLLSRDTTAAVPSAGRDAAAREAASTAPAGPYRRYMAGQKKKKSVFGDSRSQSTK